MNNAELEKLIELVLEAETSLRSAILELKKHLANDNLYQANLSRFFSGVTESTKTIDQADHEILSYIRQKGEVSRKSLTLRFSNTMKSREVQERVNRLNSAGAVSVIETKGKTRPTTVYRST